MTEWQTIETAPKDGRTFVLLGHFNGSSEEDCLGVARFYQGKWTDGFQPDWYWSGGFAPTHFMLLPDPPEIAG